VAGGRAAEVAPDLAREAGAGLLVRVRLAPPLFGFAGLPGPLTLGLLGLLRSLAGTGMQAGLGLVAGIRAGTPALGSVAVLAEYFLADVLQKFRHRSLPAQYYRRSLPITDPGIPPVAVAWC
jgi:hypothetical protein